MHVNVSDITNISNQTVKIIYNTIDPDLSVTSIPSGATGTIDLAPGGSITIESRRLESIDQIQALGLVSVRKRANEAPDTCSTCTIPAPFSETGYANKYEVVGSGAVNSWNNLNNLKITDSIAADTGWSTAFNPSFLRMQLVKNGTLIGNEASLALTVTSAYNPYDFDLSLPNGLSKVDMRDDDFGVQFYLQNNGLTINSTSVRATEFNFKFYRPRPASITCTAVTRFVTVLTIDSIQLTINY